MCTDNAPLRLAQLLYDPKLMREIQVTATKHIRAIVSDPRHVTRHTNQEVMDKYKIESMVILLQRAHGREF